MKVYRIEFADDALSVLTVHCGGDRIEFRGDPYHLWDHRDPTDVQRLHDALEGWHACVLHAGDAVAILPRHPDYAVVDELWREALVAIGPAMSLHMELPPRTLRQRVESVRLRAERALWQWLMRDEGL